LRDVAFLGFDGATFLGVPGALFWFAPLQREGMRSPGRKAGASAVSQQPTNPLLQLNEATERHQTFQNP
jgi:hypothetical protein